MAIIDIKNCTFRIEDGAGHRVDLKIGEGTLQWTQHRNVEYLLDRGLIDAVRAGDQQPVDVSFNIRWVYLKGDGVTATPFEALTQTGAAAAWTTTGTDTCEPYAVDIVLINNPPCAADTIENVRINYFRYEELQFDVKAGTISCSGKANISVPTLKRGDLYT